MTIALRRRWPWLVLAALVALASVAVVARRLWDDGPCGERARLTRQFDAAIAVRPVNVSGPTGRQYYALARLTAFAEQHPACFSVGDRDSILATERTLQPWIRLDELPAGTTTDRPSGHEPDG
jgi:hypothetical protein